MGERKQADMTQLWLKSLMDEEISNDLTADAKSANYLPKPVKSVSAELSNVIRMDVVESPSIDANEDSTLSSLAKRICEEIKPIPQTKSLAEQILEQAGINTKSNPAAPEVQSGHMKHLGQRAKKVALKQASPIAPTKTSTRSPLPPGPSRPSVSYATSANSSTQQSSGAARSRKVRKSKAPIQTRQRPATGHSRRRALVSTSKTTRKQHHQRSENNSSSWLSDL